MASAEFNFERDVLPVAKRVARRAFKGRWDVEEMTADAVHEAWLFWRNKPDAHPVALAGFGVRRVRSGRHFRQSVRSITGPARRDHIPLKRHVEKPSRVPFDPQEAFAKAGDDPAVVAGFRMDFAQWLEGLTARQRAIVEDCLAGETTGGMAERFGLSPARISQLRRELFTDWLTRIG